MLKVPSPSAIYSAKVGEQSHAYALSSQGHEIRVEDVEREEREEAVRISPKYIVCIRIE